MRKLILTVLLLATFATACNRSRDVIDRMPPGAEVALTTRDGRSIGGRLVETTADVVVVQPLNGAPVKLLRGDIATVTVSTAPAAPTREGQAANVQPAPAPAVPAPGEAPAAPGPAAMPANGDTASAAVESAPQWREVTVPAGTRLSVRLEETVSSDGSRVEQPVSATVLRNVVVQGVTAVPAGSAISGSVTHAKRSGRVKGVAELSLRFDTVTPKGTDSPYQVRTGVVARRAGTTRRRDALEIGAPAAGGAIVGGLLGGKKGALIGGGIGGGAGTAVVLGTRGKEVRLPRGTRLSIRLLEPVTVRVPA